MYTPRYDRAQVRHDFDFGQPGGPFAWLDSTTSSSSQLCTETPSQRSDTPRPAQTPGPVQPPVAPTSVARIAHTVTWSFLALQPPPPDVIFDAFPTTRFPPPWLPPPRTLGTEPAERRKFQVRLRFWSNRNNWPESYGLDEC